MVQADDPAGHAKHHADFYSKQTIPNRPGISCCNNKDCRPVKYRHTSKGIEVFVAGKWIVPPRERVKFMRTPDDGGHWCGTDHDFHTYCTFIPIPSI